MTNLARSMPAETPPLVCEAGDHSSGDIDQQILRIERIGRRLFDVPSCIVALEGMPSNSLDARGLIAAVEAAFCRNIPMSGERIAITDTRHDPSVGLHRAVIGPPYIRFYAAYPIYNPDRALVGRVSLVDYAPRAFSEGECGLLADLANLVERELQLKSVSASQLDLQKKNKNLRRKSLIDPLMGTWNRGAIMRILSIEAIRCEKEGLPLSLIVADLEYFKKINDTYGHPAGDAVLVKGASRLRSCIRPQEALGRYGGEEFLIVLPDSSSATAMIVAERMRQAIAAQPEVVGNVTLNLTISAGIASTDVFPAAGTEELINRADVALYAAKDAGRNCVMQAIPDLS